MKLVERRERNWGMKKKKPISQTTPFKYVKKYGGLVVFQLFKLPQEATLQSQETITNREKKIGLVPLVFTEFRRSEARCVLSSDRRPLKNNSTKTKTRTFLKHVKKI